MRLEDLPTAYRWCRKGCGQAFRRVDRLSGYCPACEPVKLSEPVSEPVSADSPPDTMLPRPRSWAIILPVSDRPLNLNDRKHHQVKAREVKRWRALAAQCFADEIGEPLGRVEIELHVTPPDRRRRDSDNLVALLKPLKDGLVDAGLVEDDTPEFVSWLPPVLLPVDNKAKAWRYRVVVTAKP